MPKVTTNPLTGDALLKKVKQLSGLSKSEKARLCGYVTVTKDGQERAKIMQFQNALLEASGIDMGGKEESESRGRSVSYRVSVQANGNLLIGKAYTRQLNLEPGDEFEITLGRKRIKLYKVEADDD